MLQALGQVDGVSHQRVFQPLGRPEQRGRRLAGRKTQAEPERRQAVGLPAAVDLRLQGVHVQRRGHRAVRVVGLRERRTEDRHHRVADELHHGARLAQDGLVHCGPVRVELPGELARVGVLGDGRV